MAIIARRSNCKHLNGVTSVLPDVFTPPCSYALAEYSWEFLSTFVCGEDFVPKYEHSIGKSLPCSKMPTVDCMSLVPCNRDTVIQWNCNTSLCKGFVKLHYIHTICQLAVTYLVILRQFEVLKCLNCEHPVLPCSLSWHSRLYLWRMIGKELRNCPCDQPKVVLLVLDVSGLAAC